MDVAPGTLVIYSDIGCPWAYASVHRLHETRARLGSDDPSVAEELVRAAAS